MKKKNIYKLIAVAVVAVGTFGVSNASAFAKTNQSAKLVKKIKLAHAETVKGKNGVIYSNYKLNKVVSNLRKHKNVAFKTKQKYVIKDQKGKKHTYSLIKHKKLKGVVLSNKLKLVKVKKAKKHHNAHSQTTTNVNSLSNNTPAVSSDNNGTNNNNNNNGSLPTTNPVTPSSNQSNGTTSSVASNSSTSAKTASSTASSASNSATSNVSSASSASSSSASSATSANSSASSSASSSSSATSSSNSNNAGQSANSASANELAKYFTSSEINQINTYKSEAAQIGNGNADADVYSAKPNVNGQFSTGKLNQSYIDNSIQWINFFRNMLGLSSLSENSSWSQDAQYGAAGLAALNVSNNTIGTIQHGLPASIEPSFVNSQDWQHASDVTMNSNIGFQFSYPTSNPTPYDIVSGFLNDGNNGIPQLGPGHREWLIGNISSVGIGYVSTDNNGNYYDYKVFDNSNDGEVSGVNTPVNFPGNGLFPFELVQNTPWSISVPSSSFNATPSVTIHDNTSNVDVNVSDVNAASINSGSGTAGYFGGNVWFTPDANAIKVNHSYTVTVNNLPGYSQPYTYTTKLFNLGIESK